MEKTQYESYTVYGERDGMSRFFLTTPNAFGIIYYAS
jgi:hypothetical protein